MKPAGIHHQLYELYGEHAMNDSMVRRLMSHFNGGQENVHDDPWNGRPSVVNEDMMRAVEEAIHHFITFPSLSTYFTVTSQNYVWKTLFLEIMFTLGGTDAYG
jgi:hypothetical protein